MIYNEISINCECGEKVTWKSAINITYPEAYNIKAVPILIAQDIEETSQFCPKCDRQYMIYQEKRQAIVPMIVKEIM